MGYGSAMLTPGDFLNVSPYHVTDERNCKVTFLSSTLISHDKPSLQTLGQRVYVYM